MEVKGKIKQVGLLKGEMENAERAEVEIYKTAYDLRDEQTREALKRSRHRTVREFLVAEGHVVNTLHIAVAADDDDEEPPEEVQICDYAHISSPPDRESGWIEFNCRPGVVSDL